MRLLKILGAFLLLFVANLIEVHGQGPRFESPPRGWVDGTHCSRACNGVAMNCFFHFRVETFYTMSKACFNCPTVLKDCFRPDCIVAGGEPRTVTVINRQLPGPPIEVCQYDNVRVLVENLVESGEATTIHWHGQHMSRDPYMDGVPFITQCPIYSGNNFTYNFVAATPGTHWYHSHVELQRGDGLFGAFIVRQPSRHNFYYGRYNLDDHTIIINDWNDRPRMEVFQGYAKGGQFLEPTGILINGYGPQSKSKLNSTPIATFGVTQGKVYRFRMINANFFDCPVELTVDNHTLTVIATDGEDVEAKPVNSIVSSSGERFDFLINANQLPSTYWIRVKGSFLCTRLQTFQVATLKYATSENDYGNGNVSYATANDPNSTVLNPTTVLLDNGMVSPKAIPIDKLRSVKQINPYIANSNPTRFFISLDMSGIDHPANHRAGLYGYNKTDPNVRVRTPQLNHLSFKPFDVPLLQNRHRFSKKDFCTYDSMKNKNCESEFCECAHVLEVRKNELVEMILFDQKDQEDSPAVHPMHLHGHYFHVLGSYEIGANLTREMFINHHGSLYRNMNRPPLKDTVAVPRGGAVIIRFIAENRGMWFFHCHIDVHANEGMELVLKVGNNWEMQDPPKGFPVCGNWARH